ncbi:hypothetical protein ACIPSE_14930 [Streptomyces sp. NPDC090106]|uniref:hypothetical protein n=1 Tax=Streptomyces sp. NPDC090106 TaxID=3365946 RepID=UPI0037F409FA
MSLLDWRDRRHFDEADNGARPCTQCEITTPMRSHAGEPVHKVCAEDWNDNNPAAARYEHKGRDLGTQRFHSDPPREKKSKGGAR